MLHASFVKADLKKNSHVFTLDSLLIFCLLLESVTCGPVSNSNLCQYQFGRWFSCDLIYCWTKHGFSKVPIKKHLGPWIPFPCLPLFLYSHTREEIPLLINWFIENLDAFWSLPNNMVSLSKWHKSTGDIEVKADCCGEKEPLLLYSRFLYISKYELLKGTVTSQMSISPESCNHLLNFASVCSSLSSPLWKPLRYPPLSSQGTGRSGFPEGWTDIA